MSKKKKKNGFREALGDALRKLKDKKLRKSNQIKKLFSIIVATIGVA